uniref:Uncharacterized protein n=1 Tax=Arcella intermedia TaxID=1963864 RepID=A0A6B2L527_9EUKA
MALLLNNELILPRTSLPDHLLSHPAFYQTDFITEHTRQTLLETLKGFQSLPTNAMDLKYYKTRHEHIGEAVPFDGQCPHPLLVPNVDRTLCVFPGRVDVAMHYITTGGHEGLKESFEKLASRVQSFGVYIFDLAPHPALQDLFHDPNFLARSSAVCPPDRRHLDPFQFNFIVNTPGQTVAHHLDAVYFWGATRFDFPQWLLAVMKFSGLFEERFVDQVQVVSYLHNWTDDRDGSFVFWTDNGRAKAMAPAPRSANVVDGSKVVHAAAVYRAGVVPPVLRPSEPHALVYEGDGRWSIRTDGEVRSRLSDDDLRVSIVYRARCFRDAEEARRFKELPESERLTLEGVLGVLKADLVKRGVLKAEEREGVSAFDLGMMLLKTYTRYPLPEKGLVPFNYCALPRLYPQTQPFLHYICE